jgi:uncharacterized protein YbjQ (UPF0145 family)
VDEFAAIRGAGFEPVGFVSGTVVYAPGSVTSFGCPGQQRPRYDMYGEPQAVPPPDAVLTTVSSQDRWDSAVVLVKSMYRVRRLALDRMTAECSALDGHGVVGVRLVSRPFPEGGREFTVTGTAIRAPGALAVSRRRANKHPFTSDLSAPDFARLISNGWVPAGLALGISIATRHDDRMTVSQTQPAAGNAEIAGYTDLITQARHDARRELEKDIRRLGGEGVVARTVELSVTERECGVRGVDQRDHLVRATCLGTAIVRFTRRPRGDQPVSPPLTVMSLGPWRGRESGIRIVLQT